MKNVICIMLLLSQTSCLFFNMEPAYIPLNIKGRVLDENTEVPIENIDICVDKNLVKTNSKGEFIVLNVDETKEITFSLVKEGYNSFQMTYRIFSSDSTNSYRLFLDAKPTNNGNIIIRNSLSFSLNNIDSFTFNLSRNPITFDCYVPTGMVVDDSTDLPIQNALITVNNKMIQTDSLGRFKCTDKFSKNLQIMVQKKGYKNFELISKIVDYKYIDYLVIERKKEVDYNPPLRDTLHGESLIYRDIIYLSSWKFSVSNIDKFIFRLEKMPSP